MDKIEQTTITTRGEPFTVKPDSSTNLIVAVLLTIIFLIAATVSMQMINSYYQGVQQQQAVNQQRQSDTQQQQDVTQLQQNATSAQQNTTSAQQSATQAQQQTALPQPQ